MVYSAPGQHIEIKFKTRKSKIRLPSSRVVTVCFKVGEKKRDVRKGMDGGGEGGRRERKKTRLVKLKNLNRRRQRRGSMTDIGGGQHPMGCIKAAAEATPADRLM